MKFYVKICYLNGLKWFIEMQQRRSHHNWMMVILDFLLVMMMVVGATGQADSFFLDFFAFIDFLKDKESEEDYWNSQRR